MAPFKRSLLLLFIIYGCDFIGDITADNSKIHEYHDVHIKFSLKNSSGGIKMPLFFTPILFLPLFNIKEFLINTKMNNSPIASNLLNLSLKSKHNVSRNYVEVNESFERSNKDIKKGSQPTTTNKISNIVLGLRSNLVANKLLKDVNVFATDLNNNETYINIELEIVESKPIATDKNNKTKTSEYDNKDVESLDLTVIAEASKLPPVIDERWKMFDVNYTLENGPETDLSVKGTITKKPYPPARYNNEMIDGVSITTNMYTNGKSPLLSQDDGWDTASLLGLSNGFKPLAGLYYDGFLNTPHVKTSGFIPQDK